MLLAEALGRHDSNRTTCDCLWGIRNQGGTKRVTIQKFQYQDISMAQNSLNKNVFNLVMKVWWSNERFTMFSGVRFRHGGEKKRSRSFRGEIVTAVAAICKIDERLKHALLSLGIFFESCYQLLQNEYKYIIWYVYTSVYTQNDVYTCVYTQNDVYTRVYTRDS